MAYALRYYKEFTHADGKVIRLEIHKKDSTTAAVEIGAVVQGLSLQIQGQQGDIDTPIVKTSLSMTFVDAGDIENGQKNGFWEEFYTPDSVLWKVLVKAKKAGGTAFTTIWGGYVTPDSFSESLTYRGSVNIIARDNIGHMQDFPFDAEGDEDGMISLYDLVNTAWAKIESPMSLMWDGGHWMQCEGVNGYNTLMNVSAFEDMSWYEAVEKALYSYGGVMRYIGGNEVLVTTLRYMPTFGRNIDRLPRIEPTFITGATRELVPAVKRVEESVKYELEDVIQPLVKTSDFNGNTDSVADSTGFTATTWELNNDESGKGWRNPQSEAPTYFNPASYELGEESWSFPFDNDERKSIPTAMMLLCNNRSGRAVYSRYINAYDCEVKIVFGGRYFTDDASSFVLLKQNQEYCKVVMFEYAVRVIADGITEYMQEDGSWGTAEHIFSISSSTHMGEVAIPMSFKQTGNILLEIDIVQVGVTSTLANHYIKIEAVTFANLSSKPLLESNTVNTNYQEGNNVVLSRDPEIGPAYNDVVLPGVIKNGIFRRDGSQILPAYKWGWSGSTPQQMAVYNHLQLLAYYAKPNNLISGTIVNADVTDIACIYEWHHADHILVSGNLNLLNGHIEGAMLREYARYEYLWGDVEGAGFPETEQASTTNVEGGASADGSSSTYTNNTTVNIGSGGGGGTGASQLNDLSDVDTTGVVAQSVLYYNGTSWVDMSIHTLLNPYVKGDELNRLLDEINAEIEKRALDSDLDTLAGRVGVNELAIADNAGNIKKNFDAIEVLGSSKADKATTLAGYGITDAYTTEEIDGKVTAINNAIALKADTTALEALALTVGDNTTNIRNLKDSVYTKDDLATYKAWWDDVMSLVVKDGNNIKIKTNLIVSGDTSSTARGSDAGVAGTLLGITVNGTTYNEPVNGILALPDYYTQTEVDDKIAGVDVSDQLKDYAKLSDIPSLEGYAKLTDIPTTMAWDSVTGKPTFATVATSGKYGDLTGRPTIPSKTSQIAEETNLYFTNARAVNALADTLKDYVTKTALASDLGEYASKEWVNEKGYITGITLTGDDYISVNGYQLSLAIDAQGGLTDTGQGLGIYQIPSAKIVTDALGYTPLSTAGGTIEGETSDFISINRKSTSPTCLVFKGNGASRGNIGFRSDYKPIVTDYSIDTNNHYIIHSGNYSSYALPLSGGRMTGTILIGDYTAFGQAGGNFYLGTPAYPLLLRSNGTTTINGNTLIHSGNIGSYKAGDSALFDGRTSGGYYLSQKNGIPNGDLANLGAGSYYAANAKGDINPLPIDYCSLSVLGQSYYSQQLCMSHNATRAWLRGIYNTSSGVSATDWHELAFTDSNVASATKLQTARSIWGQSFDGTGDIANSTNGTMRRLLFHDALNGSGTTGYIGRASSTNNDVYVNSAYDLRLMSGDNYTMWLNSSGNVTIGGSDLAGTNYKMYVDGVIAASRTTSDGTFLMAKNSVNDIQVGVNSSGVSYVYATGAYDMGFSTNATRRMTITSGGNVGIGTTDPQHKLDVAGNARFGHESACDIYFKRTSGYNYLHAAHSFAFTVGNSTSNVAFSLESNKSAKFYGAVTMSSTLSVTTSVTTPLLKSSGGLDIVANGSAAGSRLFLTSNCFHPWGDDSKLIDLGASNAQWRNVYAVNAIFSGDTATGSDIRFKDRIADHRIALESIAQAPLFTFKWNDREDKTEHLGTSAQYWEGVAPWLVKGTDFKVLDYSTLGVAIGISLANKTLNHEERIKILERENEQLKEQIRRIQYGS